MQRFWMAVAGMLLVAGVLPAARGAENGALKEKLATCLACHGKDGVSETDGVPSLAGQPSYFTQWQLVFLRSGGRKNEVMEPIAASLTNDEIRAIGAYFQTLAPPKPPGSADPHPALTEAGAKLTIEKHCAVCHKPTFEGQEATPRLAAQREEVLLKALQDYKAGRRTGTGVAAMPEVATALSDDEIKGTVEYILGKVK